MYYYDPLPTTRTCTGSNLKKQLCCQKLKLIYHVPLWTMTNQDVPWHEPLSITTCHQWNHWLHHCWLTVAVTTMASPGSAIIYYQYTHHEPSNYHLTIAKPSFRHHLTILLTIFHRHVTIIIVQDHFAIINQYFRHCISHHSPFQWRQPQRWKPPKGAPHAQLRGRVWDLTSCTQQCPAVGPLQK